MAVFILLPALVLLCVVLLAPLMLPGAVIVFVALAVTAVVRHHHANHILRSH